MALVLPTVTLTVAGRAEAQVTKLPTWAVTEFKDLKGANAFKYGQAAAEAVAGELAKTNRYDVVPAESVKRSIETLGLASPLESLVNLSRVGQDVRADTIIQGEILDYQVRQAGGGKMSIVALRMVAYDVVSGLPVNGTLVKGESIIKPSSATNESLVGDAISQASALAIREMQNQQLPSATVLNTGNRTSLINQGARSGFKSGDTVLITRGPLQVGVGRIGVIEPDQAEMTIERSQLGLAPGDRVRAVFTPPPLPVRLTDVIKGDGALNVPTRTRRPGSSNNATLISALLVVGLVAALLGGGNGSSQEAVNGLTAEATTELGRQPGIRLSYSRDGFYKGNGSTGNGVVRFQIYRIGIGGSEATPAIVTDLETTAFDGVSTSSDRHPLQSFTSSIVGGTTCDNSQPFNAPGRAASTPLVVGRPYRYSIEAVYRVSQNDLPTVPGTSTSGGGTTGTSTTGTSTTGTSTTGTSTTGTSTTGTSTTGTSTTGTSTTGTGTTGGTGDNPCYFRSSRTTSRQATALQPPTALSPTDVPGDTPTQTFSFTSLQGTLPSGFIETIIEFSDSPAFNKRNTVRTPAFTGTSVTLNTGGALFDKKGATGVNLQTASIIYYRVGIRNTGDRPGPVKDPRSGLRYIYSDPQTFTRTPNNFPTP